MGVLTCIAVNVLPAHLLWEHKARYKGMSNASALLVGHGQHDGCLLARRGNTLPPAYQDHGQPAFMRRASWYCKDCRWSFRLRSPGAAKQAVKDAIARCRQVIREVLEHAPMDATR